MDAQEEHDYKMSKRQSLTGTRPKLEALLRAKKASAQPQPESQGPIDDAIANNPGLTREKALEIAEKFGF